MLLSSEMQNFLEGVAAYKEGNYKIIRDLNITDKTARKIIKHDKEIAKYFLYIRKLPFEILDHMARIYGEDIQEKIALKYPLLRETYEFLSEQSENVKVSLASNKKIPKDILEKLRNDDSDFVRNFIAENNI